MLSFKFIRVIKITDIVCTCIGIGSILFGPYLVGKTASQILTVVMMLVKFELLRIVCKRIFTCPHCGGKDIFTGNVQNLGRDDVIFCPHCHKPVRFED